MSFDTVVIGGGLSGLIDAVLLAEWGRRVVVLEQHTAPGGFLQQFRRKGTTFDVGFHWVGSTRPGRPLHALFGHLGILDRLVWRPYPLDAAVEYRSGSRSFAFPGRFRDFVDRALATWSAERDAIEWFAAEVESICDAFPWISLRSGTEISREDAIKSTPRSLADVLAERVGDPWLAEVLGITAFNIGLRADEIPWTKAALAFRANFDDTSAIEGGGGALVAALIARGRELGVEYRLGCGATRLECRSRHVVAVHTSRGDRIEGELFLAACPPKELVRMLPREALSDRFRDRILAMKDSRGALQAFARLRRLPAGASRTCVVLPGPEGGTPILAMFPGDDRMEALTYTDDKAYRAWRGLPSLQRGAEYEARKALAIDAMLDHVAKVFPDLGENIESLYSATPLTDEWYTRNEHGGVFGISHDLSQQGLDRPLPRTRLRNLWLTGQSIEMPGILGVTINAFATCAGIRGDGWLFQQIAS